MSLYVHHVPGRLRLQTDRLKVSRRGCEDAVAIAGKIIGVTGASANFATGSLVIHYDQDRVTPHALWRALCDGQIVWGLTPISDDATVTRALIEDVLPTRATFQTLRDDGPARHVFETVAGAAIDKLMSRSAAAIIGALI